MSNAKLQKVIVVLGPTASGKSSLAIKLAKKFRGEIISADSRQVYHGMDIGTGKVTKPEQAIAPHFLLNVANPKKQFAVDEFVRLGKKAIADISKRGKVPIICGGTGLYIDALIYDLPIPLVPPDSKLRAKLNKLSSAELYARLNKLDPVRAKTIDRHNSRRLIRALEIVITTGKPVPVMSTDYTGRDTRYAVMWLGLNPGQEKLNKNIEKRLDQRLRQGMIAEVNKLHKNGAGWKRLESFGLEYKWVSKFLQKQLSRKEMRDGLLKDIVRYSKRQMTWFKRNKKIHWIRDFNQAQKLAGKFIG